MLARNSANASANANANTSGNAELRQRQLRRPTSTAPSKMEEPTPKPRASTAWVGVAIASGACAAFNGVFAKLTTTELTSSWSHAVSKTLGLGEESWWVEGGIRVLFFALNLVFNAIMWALFTRALTLASSTVQVSIINTSANFVLTALLGVAIFSESLPGLWWIGAALLVVGSVIIGGRDEGAKEGDAGTAGAEGSLLAGTEPEPQEPEAYRDEPYLGELDINVIKTAES